MTTAYELVVVQEKPVGSDIYTGTVEGLMSVDYAPTGPVKHAPSGRVEEVETDPSNTVTNFENQDLGRVTLSSSNNHEDLEYSGVYLSIHDGIVLVEDWKDTLIELVKRIVEESSPDFASLTGRGTPGLPETDDLSGRPGIADISYYSEKLLERHEIRPEESEADIVEEINGGQFVVPDEELNTREKFEKVASELDLDTG